MDKAKDPFETYPHKHIYNEVVSLLSLKITIGSNFFVLLQYMCVCIHYICVCSVCR